MVREAAQNAARVKSMAELIEVRVPRVCVCALLHTHSGRARKRAW